MMNSFDISDNSDDDIENYLEDNDDNNSLNINYINNELNDEVWVKNPQDSGIKYGAAILQHRLNDSNVKNTINNFTL